jgi:replicative DNA helicase
MKPIPSLPLLKRRARLLARRSGEPLHMALDRTAAQYGYASWSLLAARAAEDGVARAYLAKLQPGDLALIGARPGQGKTVLALRIGIEVVRSGGHCAFFTLEDAPAQIERRLEALGTTAAALGDTFTIDCSDTISADYLIDRLRHAPSGTLAVVDYLQLLDQQRAKPELALQLDALKRFASERGLTFLFLSQIDRAFDPATKSVPDFDDLRLPNPLQTGQFAKACFLHAGKARFHG